MGLDMYLSKTNKKVTQEQLNKIHDIKNEIEKYDNNKYIINDVESYNSIRDFILEEYDSDIEYYKKMKNKETEFEKIIYLNGEAISLIKFKTLDDLCNELEKSVKKDIFKIKLEVSKAEANKEFMDNYKKYKNYKLEPVEDVAYWRKHADLNEYFTKIANERIKGVEFNCVYLVLTKKDVEDLCENVTALLEKGEKRFETGLGFLWGKTDKSDWISTKKVFDELLNEFDFENNTLLYYCWY